MTGSDYKTDSIKQKLEELSNNADTTNAGKLIKSEADRLIKHQGDILDAKFSQNRIIEFNRDQIKRTAAYTKVGVLLVISLGIIMVFNLLGDLIPDAVITLIYITLISACLFYGLYIYIDVNGRDKTNFDRYNIPPPPINNLSDAEKVKQQDAAAKTGDLLAMNALSDNTVCSGQGCCDYDQAYNSTLNKCDKCTSGQYFIKANNACGTCAGSTPHYISSTQSCITCAGSTPNYISSTQSCSSA